MKPTIKQVAREAGVSIATVSRVSSGKGPVSAATRKRIVAVSRRLGYVPDVGAQSLVTHRTRTIGVLLPMLHAECFVDLLRGIDGAARRHGYHLLVSGFHGCPAELEKGLAAAIVRVDGLLAVACGVAASRVADGLPTGVPVIVLSGSASERAPQNVISVDNEAGAASVVRHLAALGHRRIGFVKGPETSGDAAARLRAYRRTLRSVRAAVSRALEADGDFTEESGYRAGRQLLSLASPPTAIFAANDAMAVGVLSASRRHRRRVPADVAVVGFGDSPAARFVSPTLTTVRVPMEELGRRATERLLSVLRGGANGAWRGTLPTSLVVRASCGGRSGRPGARRRPRP